MIHTMFSSETSKLVEKKKLKSYPASLEMPPKKQKIDDDESSSSAAEEESQNSSASTEEESDSESEKQEPDSKANRKQNAPVNQPTARRKESESNEEDSVEVEDDEKGSSSVSDPPIKPITLRKPPVKNTNPASKRSLELPKGNAKESRTNKKAKTSEENERKTRFTSVYDGGRSAIFRVWSWENEIALLQGAIDYINEEGSDPSANMSDFYEFVKGDLFSGVSKSQVYVKFRKFKARFFRLQGTGEYGGDPVFSNPFEYKAFELSKTIWGGGIQSTSQVFLAKYPNFSESFDMEVGFLKDNVHLIGHTKAKKLEEKWTKLRIEEMEVVTKKLSLMAGQIKLVLDAVKKG